MSTPPLVLLHAFPVDARMWDGVRDRIAARTRLITPDQRGLGRTALPETDREPSLDDAARDLLALLDKLEVDRVVLGGCSMGGYVAMAALRAAPERIAGLVLIDTKASADGGDARANRAAMAERVEREGVGEWLADAVLPGVLGPTTRAERPDVVLRALDLVKSQPAGGVAWAQRAMAARPDSFDTLRAADVPALVVVGEEDTLSPRADAEAMVSALPQAELVVIPSAGHLAPMETPDAVGKAILNWLPVQGAQA